jgi:hypothetical protein
MADVTGLVERLEKATGGPRSLEKDILRALGYHMRRVPMDSFVYWAKNETGFPLVDVLGDDCDNFTASLDAALALVERVLPGWDICLSRVKGDEAVTWNAVVGEPDSFSGSEATSPTPALALCLAALKALAQGNEGSDEG